jgi:tetratricopeptide (TPR) repeat protein
MWLCTPLNVGKQGTEADKNSNVSVAKNDLYVFKDGKYKYAKPDVKSSAASKPPFQEEKVNSIQKIASVENDEKKLQGNTNNLSKSSSKLIRSMLNLAMDNGGINHELEIQQIVSQITSSPKNQTGNKKLARDFNDKGHAFLKDEDFDSAVEMFEKAYQANPSDIEITNNLGFTNMKVDNLDAAEKYLIETLVLSPTRATAWANLGDLYALKDEESKAVACYANMYRFSKNRLNTDKFMRKLNESEYFESLKSARDKAIRSANSWFSF